MRVLLLFNVDFCHWPVHIAQQLRRDVPELEIDGVVTIDRTVTETLSSQTRVAFGELHCLSGLERGWLSTHAAADLLVQHEAALGRGGVAEIAIADRELSGGWVSGGTIALSPLGHAARDPAAWAAYLAGMISFFRSLMERRRYDLVFCYPVQDGPSVAAGVIARALGVPFLSPKAIGFQAKTCLFDDVKTMTPVFRHDFNRAAEDPGCIGAEHWRQGRDLLEQFRARPAPPDYMSIANAWTYEGPGPMLTASLIKRTVLRQEPISLRYPYPLARLVWEYGRWFKMQATRRHPMFKQSDVLRDRPYAFFPLHYEPEASTLVSAPYHTDQTTIIEQTAKAIPAHWLLAVKEHVPMLGRRPAGFYERLRRMPKVVLITPYADSFSLNKSAQLTVTITGTAGLEAVLLGRPVLFLGESPVNTLACGHLYRPETCGLADAVDAAISLPPAGEDVLVRFLAALCQHSVDVQSRLIWGGASIITDEVVANQSQTVARFAHLILEEIARSRADQSSTDR